MRIAHRIRPFLSLAGLSLVGTVATPLALATAASPLPAATAPAAARSLDFKPSALRLFRDPESGEHFWYFTYEVVNKTGQDQRFAPRIELLTDEGRIVREGDGVPGRIQKAIKKYLGNPLLEDQFEILGTVLQGEEHARTGLVVFLADDLAPTELAVFVQGLSRETKKTENPKTGEPVTLRRTTRIDYLVPGDPQPKGTVSYDALSTDDSIFR
ncbi:MAG: hypothetical protein RIS86_812 [Planctomycetota bacterium]